MKQYFSRPTNHLVHDPNSSLVAGDVVELHRLRVSTIVYHVVASIITPFGTPISERPPVPTPDERLAKYKERRFVKLQRRELRQKAAGGDVDAIQELKGMGLVPDKDAARTRTPKQGALSGQKGQKSPDGKHEVGKINERAKKNKERAMKLDAQAEKNLLEAKELEEELQTEKEFGAKTIVPKQGSLGKVVQMPQAGQSRGA